MKVMVIKKVSAGERVQINALPEKSVGEVTPKVKQHVWDTIREMYLLVVMGVVSDLLQGRETAIAEQVARGVTDLRNVSKEVRIAVCMVPEVERQGYGIERAVLAVNGKVSTLDSAMNFKVIHINRDVHRAGREGAPARDGTHLSDSVETLLFDLLSPPTFISAGLDHRNNVGINRFRTRTCFCSIIPQTSED